MKNTGHTPQDLLHELHTLVREDESMVANSAAEHSAGALDSLRARFDAAHERCAEAYAGARQKVIAGAKCTDEAIRANPYQSMAITAGVALLVGVFVGRSSK